MKQLKLFLPILLLFISLNVFGQSKNDIKNLLDDYCEEYFEDCFGWKYYSIVSIDRIENTANNKAMVYGKVKNAGYFGTTHIREFKTEIKRYSAKTVINFSKQEVVLGEVSWKDCKNTIYD